MDACIELAKYFEHHEVMLETAFEWTERAGKILKQKRLRRDEHTHWRAMLDRRRERLSQKIIRKTKKEIK
jgi:hypothetical protein